MRKIEDMEIGIRIRRLRYELGMDQKEMANKIGSSVQALSNWENGKNKPKPKMLESIAQLTHTHPNKILYGNLKNFLKSNIHLGLSIEANFIADYVKEDTLNVILNKLQKKSTPYDYSSLSEVVSRYERKLIFDYFESISDENTEFIKSLREGLINKGIDELSNYARQISENNREPYERILNLLMFVAGIDSSNIHFDGIDKKLAVKKSELRIAWFSHNTEKQVPTGQTNIHDFYDLKYWLNRDSYYHEYTKIDEYNVKIERKDLAFHYNGKELTRDDLIKIEEFIKSLT